MGVASSIRLVPQSGQVCTTSNIKMMESSDKPRAVWLCSNTRRVGEVLQRRRVAGVGLGLDDHASSVRYATLPTAHHHVSGVVLLRLPELDFTLPFALPNHRPRLVDGKHLLI